MDYKEALEWLQGSRSLTNTIPKDPLDSWIVRTSAADAAQTEQAYWVVRAHKEGLVDVSKPPWKCRRCGESLGLPVAYEDQWCEKHNPHSANTKDAFVAWWEAQTANSDQWTTLERIAAKDAWFAAIKWNGFLKSGKEENEKVA